MTYGSFEIKLYDYTPIYHRPRRFPDPIANEIEQECEKLRAQDIIEPSLSPYNCRVLPIRKGDGTLRLCMDYRDLNAKTIPSQKVSVSRQRNCLGQKSLNPIT